MESFVVSAKVLGSDRNMLIEPDGFSMVERPPPDAWLLTGSTRNSGAPCLDSLLLLGNVALRASPPEKYTRMMSTLSPGVEPPWSQVMPQAAYKSYVKNLLKSIVGCMGRLPREYCRVTWMKCGSVLESLRPAKVDGEAFREIGSAGNGALETFRPGPGGYAQPVVYDRFSTRTGRLTVASGPSILTLKKEYRRILRSHFPGGRIMSLDFSALEARIVLAEAGVMPRGDDIYTQVSSDLFGGSIPRDVIKVAVLAELYGASKSMLSNRLGMSGKKLDTFVDSMRSYFRTDELKRRLKADFESTGFVHNRYGRPLTIDDASSDHLFVNTYAQSTGVDVSLLGFRSVLDRLGTDGIRPLFVLHDALILDVREDRMADVSAVSSATVPTYDADFPLKLEKIA